MTNRHSVRTTLAKLQCLQGTDDGYDTTTYDASVPLMAVSLPPFSCPSCLEYLRPCALILLKTWRYISRLLTYLLT